MTNPQDQKRSSNFAPFSSANSTGLRLASGYFIVSGVLTIIILCVGLATGMLSEPAVAEAVKKHPLLMSLGVAMQFIASAGWIWTGILLNRRRRLGGILAVAFLLLPLISIVAPVPISMSTIVLSVLGLLVVASIWNELVFP